MIEFNSVEKQFRINQLKSELELFCRKEIEKLKREISGGGNSGFSIKREELDVTTTGVTTGSTTSNQRNGFNFIFDICLDGEQREFAVNGELLKKRPPTI
jgi:hypothetical protein